MLYGDQIHHTTGGNVLSFIVINQFLHKHNIMHNLSPLNESTLGLINNISQDIFQSQAKQFRDAFIYSQATSYGPKFSHRLRMINFRDECKDSRIYLL